jgi:hypothetical protein
VLLEARRADGAGVARPLNAVLVPGDAEVRKAKGRKLVSRLNNNNNTSETTSSQWLCALKPFKRWPP